MADILQKCGFEYMQRHDTKFDFRTSVYEEYPGPFMRQGGKGERPPFREEHAARLERNLAKLRKELGLGESELF